MTGYVFGVHCFPYSHDGSYDVSDPTIMSDEENSAVKLTSGVNSEIVLIERNNNPAVRQSTFDMCFIFDAGEPQFVHGYDIDPAPPQASGDCDVHMLVCIELKGANHSRLWRTC